VHLFDGVRLHARREVTALVLGEHTVAGAGLTTLHTHIHRGKIERNSDAPAIPALFHRGTVLGLSGRGG